VRYATEEEKEINKILVDELEKEKERIIKNIDYEKIAEL
jgi:DNA replication initiation complex subunit (GINS family)